jgi:Arc/MetJ-type ribon-helix-helix transcriptional regulator
MLRNLVHINVPTKLYDIIEELVVKSGMYRSVPEFALECMRNKMYDLREQRIERQKLHIYFKRQKEKITQSASQKASQHKD